MPYCAPYGYNNDTHDAPRELSFHGHLPLKKQQKTWKSQVNTVHTQYKKN